ncbi:MAG: biotin--[acetyl-CoA-carboxylase] ligase [Bacteroidales bacterium]|nr:biotin--[acetyl-CoA-carboxylase] ligase [Bacteroidales bacterium]MCF8332632.1 biotin--[acetyl-CoA-carboxylase] ligase [Bacteroidales bacterium]
MKILSEKIIRLTEVDSTNDYLLPNYKNFEEGTIVITDYQPGGKGLGHNHWESAKEKNLTLSVLLNPRSVYTSEQFNLNMAASLAIRKFISHYTDTPILVKWPNDIYAQNRKIAGILIKNLLYEDIIDTSIIGMGININQEHFYSQAPNPVSLKHLTGKNYNLKQMLELLLKDLDNYFQILYNRDFNQLNQEYYQYMYRLKEWHNYIIHGQKVHACIQGIDEFGQLSLTDEQGRLYVCDLKEIEFLLDS